MKKTNLIKIVLAIILLVSFLVACTSLSKTKKPGVLIYPNNVLIDSTDVLINPIGTYIHHPEKYSILGTSDSKLKINNDSSYEERIGSFDQPYSEYGAWKFVNDTLILYMEYKIYEGDTNIINRKGEKKFIVNKNNLCRTYEYNQKIYKYCYTRVQNK